MAGAAAVHAAIARGRGNDGLATVQKRAALAGALIAPVCLIADLGVPARFINMLRVFKVTSPMSIGSWTLVAFSAAIGASTGTELLGWKRTSVLLEMVAAGFGPLLATYTAVLIADTATPVWHEAYSTLPFIFIASGIAGAGAVGSAFGSPAESASAKRMMIGGALGMSIAGRLMERQIGTFLSEPYRTGRAGKLKPLSAGLAITGAAIGTLGRNNRFWTCVAASAVAAAGVIERFTVLDAGKQSALNPKYVVESQRARLDANGGVQSSLA